MEHMETNEAGQDLTPAGVKKSWKISLRTAIIIGVIAAVGGLGYFYKGLFVVAMVNGRPISHFSLISKLEKSSGKQTLEQLVTQQLIVGELNKKKVNITDDELSAGIKKIEDQIAGQGSTLDQALASQNMTRADLREQMSINLRVEKFFSDQIQVGDDEVAKYIKDHKVSVPKGQEAQFKEQIRSQLKSSKLNQVAQNWISSLRTQASIHYFVKY